MGYSNLTPEELFRILKTLWRLLAAVFVAQIAGIITGLTIDFYHSWFFNFWYGGVYATPVGYLGGLFWLWTSQPGILSKEKIPVIFLGVISFILPIYGYFFSSLVPEFEMLNF